MILVGIDCAVDARNVGLAIATYSGQRCEITHATAGSSTGGLPAQIVRLLANEPVGVIAFDAPLGWPLPLRSALAGHVAGAALAHSADDMFRRETDRQVRQRHALQSLDVGADRIARTAHSALELLAEIRTLAGRSIPLALKAGPPIDLVAIEVYPAATLKAHTLPFRSYKKPEQGDVRGEILDGLLDALAIACDHKSLLENADVLDAAVCVLSALDFVGGSAVDPANASVARAEGWIWVR